MRSHPAKWSWRSLATLITTAAVLMSMGACPIDNNTVITETVRAALNSMVSTFIDTLGQYLAGN